MMVKDISVTSKNTKALKYVHCTIKTFFTFFTIDTVGFGNSGIIRGAGYTRTKRATDQFSGDA